MRRLLVIALLVIANSRAPSASADPPPVEAFFRHPDIGDVSLSPSGRWLAITTTLGSSRVALAVIDLNGKEEPRVAARFSDADVLDFRWVNDDRLVLRIIDRELGAGDQRGAAGLFSVRRTGDELRQLIDTESPLRAGRRIGREPLTWHHGLLAVPQTGGDDVIVGEYRVTPGHDFKDLLPKRLNVVTQRMTSLAYGSPDSSHFWMFDPLGEPRLILSRVEGMTTVYWRAPGRSDWVQIAKFPTLHAVFDPVAVDPGGTLYVRVARGKKGYSEVHRFDFAAGAAEKEPLIRTPGFDFTGTFVFDPDRGRFIGVRVTTDAETTHWFDPRMKQIQKTVDERFPGRVNRLSCRRCDSDDAMILIESWSDRDPGSLLLFRPASGQWQSIGSIRKDIDPAQMSPVDFFRFRARDGLEIPVWVTLPKGAKAKEPGPAVVLVHGGPWVRGGLWRWNSEAQFLASRGYVVIEPEFRGSAGFGRAHFEAGWKQWGRAMQDDLADAAQWAVGKGWVDPKRVCIAGASYGGYATLMGLVRHPELYRCGAAWVAVTDPRLLFKWTKTADLGEEARLFSMPQLIGDPEKDEAALVAVSPVEQAARIKAPVLLAFGGGDRRVPIEHGRRMRDALRAAGREPEWVLYEDEAHGWLKEENRIDFGKRLERFLAQHLQ